MADNSTKAASKKKPAAKKKSTKKKVQPKKDQVIVQAVPADSVPVEVVGRKEKVRSIVNGTVRYGAIRLRLERNKTYIVHPELANFLRKSDRCV